MLQFALSIFQHVNRKYWNIFAIYITLDKWNILQYVLKIKTAHFGIQFNMYYSKIDYIVIYIQYIYYIHEVYSVHLHMLTKHTRIYNYLYIP